MLLSIRRVPVLRYKLCENSNKIQEKKTNISNDFWQRKIQALNQSVLASHSKPFKNGFIIQQIVNEAR